MPVDIFLKLGDVEGESRVQGKEGWIDVLSWSWGMTQSGTMHTGMGGGGGKVSVQDIQLTKYVDKSTPDIMQKCCKGKHYDTGKLVVRKAGGDPVEYLVLELNDVLITSINQGASGSLDRVTENLTLNFAKYRAVYTPQNQDGSAGATLEQSWDIAKNV